MLALHQRRLEALEKALADPTTAGPATEALRALINAILVFLGAWRCEVPVTLFGDLAAFLHANEAESARGAPDKKAALRVQTGCSQSGVEYWEHWILRQAATGGCLSAYALEQAPKSRRAAATTLIASSFPPSRRKERLVDPQPAI